jgi:ribonuclease HII
VPRRWSALERDLRESRGPLLAGVDEVGRGPLAGPVVACAVVMPPDARAIRGVDDSKELDGPEREKLARRIRERALGIGVGAASVREIDRINIYHASVLAIRRAISRCRSRPTTS